MIESFGCMLACMHSHAPQLHCCMQVDMSRAKAQHSLAHPLDDLLLRICHHLAETSTEAEANKPPQDLFRLAQVAKRFHAVLAASSSLWSILRVPKTLSMQLQESPTLLDAFLGWIKRCASVIEQLYLHDCSIAVTGAILGLVRPYLDVLEWQQHPATAESPSAKIQAMVDQLAECAHLGTLRLFVDLPQHKLANRMSRRGLIAAVLVHLRRSDQIPTSGHINFNSLVQHLPNLHRLDLAWDFSFFLPLAL